MSSFARFLHCCVSDGIPQCSFNVALVVGTLLNIINQGDALIGLATISWPKIALTYLVPYCVSTYGAVVARLRHERRGS